MISMHKFLRAAGFSMYQKKRDIASLLDLLQKQPSVTGCVELDSETNLCEMRTEVAPGIGISIVGELNEEGEFEREYYLPYLENMKASSYADCSIQRHAEKETYAGMADEMKIGISLIFYVQNLLEYREKKQKKSGPHRVKAIHLSGLSVMGKILLPVKKTPKQIEIAKAAMTNRNNLIEAARNGDERAMETLTIEDIDMYSKISRRAMREDLYSIIDSCFMPYGIECDQYSIIGEIKNVHKVKNIYTKEEIYILDLECNDLLFNVCINSQDLVGHPEIGRRFKGQIWLQGALQFEEIPRTSFT